MTNVPSSLGLTDEMRNNIVVSFIIAYMDTKVQLDFPRADFIKKNPDLIRFLEIETGTQVDKELGPLEIEQKLISDFKKNFSIASRSIPADDDQIKQAVNTIYDWLITLRIGDRLKGEYIGVATLQSRLENVETEVKSVKGMLNELLFLERNVQRLQGSQGGAAPT